MPSPEAPLAGSCACGTVQFEVTAEFMTAGYCHCTRCQRRAGTPWSMNGMVGPMTFEVLAGEESCAIGVRRTGSQGVLRGLRRARLVGRTGRR